MKCGKCGGKGYIEEWYHVSNSTKPLLRQCCDIAAYSRAVQLRTQSDEDAFKAVGRKDPFIGKEFNATYRGLEFKAGREKKEGEPCKVIPLKRR